MAIICPTVTPYNTDDYYAQIDRIREFAPRIHLDFMDGVFAPTHSPDLASVQSPEGVTIDLHVMFQKPADHLEAILRLKPHLVITHAEAEGDFVAFARTVRDHGIKVGIALLPETPVADMLLTLPVLDHVLIFSGDLGHFGGKVDMTLLAKVQECKELKPELEIGWDGGINDSTVHLLAAGGVDVLNVGGFIQKASDPSDAYAKLKAKL